MPSSRRKTDSSARRPHAVKLLLGTVPVAAVGVPDVVVRLEAEQHLRRVLPLHARRRLQRHQSMLPVERGRLIEHAARQPPQFLDHRVHPRDVQLGNGQDQAPRRHGAADAGDELLHLIQESRLRRPHVLPFCATSLLPQTGPAPLAFRSGPGRRVGVQSKGIPRGRSFLGLGVRDRPEGRGPHPTDQGKEETHTDASHRTKAPAHNRTVYEGSERSGAQWRVEVSKWALLRRFEDPSGPDDRPQTDGSGHEDPPNLARISGLPDASSCARLERNVSSFQR
jgi:hypothetical protein